MLSFAQHTDSETVKRLDSAMKVIIEQHSQGNQCAVSVSVQAGHFNSPKSIPGLAHLFEHMIFMGSKNHPEPNAIVAMMGKIGGSVNAWTSSEFTNFHFTCPNEYFPYALSLLSDMLTFPTFDISSIEREIETIEQEYQSQAMHGGKQLLQVQRETSNPLHPFSNFSTGNGTTFKQHSSHAIQVALKQFHQRYYHPSNMSLCVISDESAEKVTDIISELFSVHPNSQTAPPLDTLPPLHTEEQLGCKIQIQLTNTEQLLLLFPLKYDALALTRSALDVLAHLLLHQERDGLCQSLLNQELVRDIRINEQSQGSRTCEFSMVFDLTPKGIEQQLTIAQRTLQAVRKVQASLRDTWRIEEVFQLNKLNAITHENVSLLDKAIQDSTSSQLYLESESPYFTELSLEQVSSALSQVLLQINSHNMRLFYLGESAKTDRTTQWHPCHYNLSTLSEEQHQFCYADDATAQIQLASPNPYIVTNFNLKPIDEPLATPQKIYPTNPLETRAINAWLCNQDQFSLPKGDCFVAFNLPQSLFTAENQVLKGLWATMAQQALDKHVYPAQISGMNCHLYAQQSGITLKTSGLCEHQFDLLKTAFRHIHHLELTPTCFEQAKQRQIVRLKNQLNAKPISLLFHYLSNFVQFEGIEPTKRCHILQNCSFEQLNATHQKITSEYALDALFYGNWHRSETEQLCDWLNRYADKCLTAIPQKENIVTPIQHNKEWVLPVVSEHSDNTVVIYIQPHIHDIFNTVVTYLLDQFLSSRFFHEIRAVRQLGYHVGCGYYPINQHPGLAFYVQSNVASTEVIIDVIHQFMSQQALQMDMLSDEDFEQIRQSLCFQIGEKPINSSLKAQKIWVELGNGDYLNKKQKRLHQATTTIKKDEFITRAKEILTLIDSSKITLFTYKTNKSEIKLPGQLITNFDDFRTSNT